MGKISQYKGPAREFSESSRDFDLMLQMGYDFLAYLALWSGEGEPPENADGLGQQERLGIARAMAIAIEKNG